MSPDPCKLGTLARMVLAAALVASPLFAPAPLQAQPATEPSPYELARRKAGEPVWAPLLRLRTAEARFVRDTSPDGEGRRQTYLQLLAQAEATFGNHQRALQAWDRLGRAPGGDVTAARARFSAARQVDVFDTLVAVADTARVIMINERHHAASDRLLTLRLLRALRTKGYRYFAAEAFSPEFVQDRRAFATDDDGYASEPVFAEVVREARRLGYVLVSYEATAAQFEAPDSLTPQQRRDFGQAQNLAAATVDRDPQAKVLVHAGFDHVRERATSSWSPMAAYFRARTGIDPVTVDQTSGSERGSVAYAHPVHRALPGSLSARGTVFISDSTGTPIGSSALLVDFVAIRAADSTIAGRPAFLTMDGSRMPVRISAPECRVRHCVLMAQRATEPADAAVLDRVELTRSSAATLFLPREPVRLSLHTVQGTRLRQWTYRGVGR